VASYSPTIINNSTPGLPVTMAGDLTYDEFVNSLGQFNYRIKKYYLGCIKSIAQLMQSIFYNINDSDGNASGNNIAPNVDPYQLFNSVYMDLGDKEIILDSNSSLGFNLLASEQITMQLYCEQVGVTDPMKNENNFNKADDPLDLLELYQKYNDTL
jgi:hypothetical protein